KDLKEYWEDMLLSHDDLGSYFDESIWKDLQKRKFHSAMMICKVFASQKEIDTEVSEEALLSITKFSLRRKEVREATNWMIKTGILLQRRRKNEGISYRAASPNIFRWLGMQLDEEEIKKWRMQ
ncbi:MAG: hypothetical protein AAFV85_27030, partial [Cyanobacteria bacterium J06634_6]